MQGSFDSLGRRIPLGLKQRIRRRTRRVRLGMLDRTTPLSQWGRARGTPIDRIYIEDFLERNRAAIRGRVLEVKDSKYTERFGSGVTQSDVLDIDSSNSEASLIADLAEPDALPAEAFDCFILTQTLQLVSDPRQAIANCHRLLRPGGVLLATMPTITRSDNGYDEEIDRWRFTARACRDLFGEVFGENRTTVTGHGNVLTAIAFLAGLAAEEFRASDLKTSVPEYHMLITVRAERTDEMNRPSGAD
jgi:SAM-dependent methyltransferase